jgi:hypothetical protein
MDYLFKLNLLLRLLKNLRMSFIVIPLLMRNPLKINMLWIPAFAGMTRKKRFFNSLVLLDLINILIKKYICK